MPLSQRPGPRGRQLANLTARPPAPEPGNARALTHGGHASPRLLPVAGKARAIYEALSADAPLRDGAGDLPAADRTAVELLALCLARIESVAGWLELHGLLDPSSGEPRAAVDLERRLRVEAAGHCADLGLTPRARAALGLDLVRGFDLAQAMSALTDGDGDRG